MVFSTDKGITAYRIYLVMRKGSVFVRRNVIVRVAAVALMLNNAQYGGLESMLGAIATKTFFLGGFVMFAFQSCDKKFNY